MREPPRQLSPVLWGFLLLLLLYGSPPLTVQAQSDHCTRTTCTETTDTSCKYAILHDFWTASGSPGNPFKPLDNVVNGLTMRVPDDCQDGFEAFDGRCYAYSLGKLGAPTGHPTAGLGRASTATWAQAESICMEFEGDAVGGCHLASIHTPRENCFVYERIQSHVSFQGGVVVRDRRGYNDYNGCHSNTYGWASRTDEKGVCWLGLDQKAGTEGTAYAWNDGTKYDRRPYRSRGFTPWGGNNDTASCFVEPGNVGEGEIQNCAGKYYEPNNIAGGTEDCTHMWDRYRTTGEWNDEPCTNVYPYVCAKVALCQAGFWRSALYKGMPKRKDATLVDFGVDASYSTGMCTECQAGTYHGQRSIPNNELQYERPCSPCAGGYMGNKRATNATCHGICPPGKYCPEGTPSDMVPLCPSGTYNPFEGKASANDCLLTTPGKYAGVGATEQLDCARGRCGFSGAGDEQCQSPCPAGYYCAKGTGCLGTGAPLLPKPCDAEDKFAPSGSFECSTVSPGEYTYGQTPTTRTSKALCPPGYWCTGGKLNACGAGTYNALLGQSSSASCLQCAAGYFCPPGSTTAIQEVCGLYPHNATMYYCPAGTTERKIVSPKHYSVLTSVSNATRSGQVMCTDSQVCVNGVASDVIVLTPASCSALPIAENRVDPFVRKLDVTLNSYLNPALYTIKYNLTSFTLADDLLVSMGNGPCNPNHVGNEAPYSNKGIFALDANTGELTVERTTFPFWLDYEPMDAQGLKCPTAGVRYKLNIVVTAAGEGIVASLPCTIPVTVLDQNDDPVWTKELGQAKLYRTMAEKSPINTAVGLCTSADAAYGCPVVHVAGAPVEIQAVDHDYYSILRYSFVLGQGSALNYQSEDDNPFRINSCSGLITMRQDRAISFLDTKMFNFTVMVVDDGNGGQFPPKSDNISLVIFIKDAPDNPVLMDSNTYNFTVKENMPMGQLVGKVEAFDPDVGSVITYRLQLPVDGDAFYMDPTDFSIRTSRIGAETIDFESSKRQYIITVIATDETGLTDTKSYTINVLNTNDPPTFSNIIPYYIRENSAQDINVCASTTGICSSPTPADRIQIIDVDANPVTDPTEFTITGGRSDLFKIDLSTGQISTRAGSRPFLDFEGSSVESVNTRTGRRFLVTVTAKSTGVEPAETSQEFEIYLVDVNEAPYFTYTPIFYVLETAPIGSACEPLDPLQPWITAQDPDNADLYLRGVLAPQQTVSISRNNAAPDANLHDGGQLFSVFSPGSGRAAIQTSGNLNFESASATHGGATNCGAGATASTRCYRIRLQVTDNGDGPQLIDYTWAIIRIINVNDGPTFVAPFSRSILISENITAVEQAVGGEYFATDEDVGDSLTFSIAESSTGATFFDLVTTPTSVSLRKKAGVVFDYESGLTSYTINVKVSDGNPSKLIGTACSMSGSVVTGCDAGSACQEKTLPYRSEFRCYEYCSAVGVTFVPRRDTYFCDYTGLTRNAPDYKQAGDELLKIAITITDNNDPPYILDFDGIAGNGNCMVNGSVANNRFDQAQTAIAPFVVMDQDVTYAHAPFTFVATNPADAFWSTFSINYNTGAITSIANQPLALNQVFTASVTVRDEYPHVPFAAQGSSTCQIHVVVSEANEKPVFSVARAPQTFAEMSELGAIVFADVSAFDPDASDVLTYTMSQSPYFSLELNASFTPPRPYIILQGAPLDYEELQPSGFKHSIVIRVQDRAGAQDVQTLTVSVTDVNEAPRFFMDSKLLLLPENTTQGTVLQDLTLISEDPDKFANGVTTFKNTKYTLQSGCPPATCPFEVTLNTGLFRLKAGQVPNINYESAIKSWTIVVRATDGGPDASLYDEITLNVELTDINEPPKIQAGQVFYVDEGAAGTFLTNLNLLISDPDSVDTIGKLQVNITGGDPTNIFLISAGSLYVGSGGNLDYEDKRVYTLSVTVTDTAGNKDTGSFTVNVRNKNDVSVSNVQIINPPASLTLACNAATRIRITGTNFGLVSKSPLPTLVVTLRRAVTYDDPNPPLITATNCAVTSSANTEIECDVPAGTVGVNLLLDVAVTVTGTDIAGDKFSGFQTTLRSGLPTITAVSNVAALSTAGGGGVVTVTGTCFGTASSNVMLVASLTGLSRLEFCHFSACVALSNCVVTSPIALTCTNSIPSAVGRALKWKAVILGQAQAAYFEAGAYAPPTLASSNYQLPNAKLPTNGFPPSPYYKLVGTNFGPLTTVVTKAYFEYAATATIYNFVSCTVTVANTEVTCQSSNPGVGQNMRAYIEIGGQSSAASAFMLSFEQPTVTAIGGVGAANAKTEGGQSVDITGTNFGAVCGIPGPVGTGVNCNMVVATYTRGSVSATTGLPLKYTSPLCAVISQSMISCITAPGTGAGHVWSLVIGGVSATVSPTAGTTSYAAPVTTGYSGLGAFLAKTNGMQEIVIEGTNFGPLGGALVMARYGDKDIDPIEFASSSCVVTTAHTHVTCLTAPGAGADLGWIVTVDGLEGRNGLTNYAAPRLTSTNLVGKLNNDGGSVFTITGTNFGPSGLPGPYLLSSTFGPLNFPSAYPALCTVIDHEHISCTAPAGAGKDFVFQINVKDQVSPVSLFTLSYTMPSATSIISTPVKRTDGGNTAFLLGEGFSLCDAMSTVRVQWREESSIAGATTRLLDISSKRDATGTVVNPACPLGTTQSQVGFVVPEMNVARSVYVRVQVTSARTGETYTSGPELVYAYDAPQLDSIFAEASLTPGYTQVTVFGRNLCKSESCCQTFLANKPVPLHNVLAHTHSKIVLLSEETGNVVVNCQGTASNSLGFVTNSPFIFGTVPQLDEFEFKTVGGETLEIWGLFLGETAPNVTLCLLPFGSMEACYNADNSTEGSTYLTLEVLNHTSVSCTSPSRPATSSSYGFDSNSQCYMTKVVLPALTGQNLPISVQRGSARSVADDTRFEFLSYKQPVVTGSSGSAFERALDTNGGGAIITLEGTNFGVLEGTVYLDGGAGFTPVECEVQSWSDSSISCIVKEGDGAGLSVIVVQNSGVSVVVPDVDVDFLPPSDLTFVQDNFLTEGGQDFYIFGKNLGRAGKPIIKVSTNPCVLLSNNATVARCRFPMGEGIFWPVSVEVSAQIAVAEQTVSYGPPEISNITPDSSLPTEGGVRFVITGKNFGFDKLRVYFDQFLVRERTLDVDEELYQNPFIIAETNHTHIAMMLPPFFGSNRTVQVAVRGQFSPLGPSISFEKPDLGNVSVVNEDGSQSTPFNAAVDFVFPTSAFNASSPIGLSFNSTAGNTRRRRRALAALEQSYGMWRSSAFSVCQSSVRAQKPEPLFWKYFNEFAPNGEFRKTFVHYHEGRCLGQATETFKIVVEGKVTDEGLLSATSAVSSCGLTRVYSERVNRVAIELVDERALAKFTQLCSCFGGALGVQREIDPSCLQSQSTCPLLFSLYGDIATAQTKYGAYVISNDVDLWMAEPVNSVAELEAKTFLNYPDVPTGSVSRAVAALANTVPKGPTDGCYAWESLSNYLLRADGLMEATPTLSLTQIPRFCLRKALMTISGTNLGEELSAAQLSLIGSQPPSLRVYLVSDDPSVAPFEASTVASRGNQAVLCPRSECFQTHRSIRFWLPYGTGKSLRIRVHVGDQSTFASTRFSYSPPTLEELTPGTVRLRRNFQSSEGEPIAVKGKNFGGTITPTQLLLGGKVCTEATWVNGQDDSDGRPYVTCNAPRDVVGPKSVLLCVANQLSFTKMFKTDGPVLIAGEAFNAWTESNAYTSLYSSQLRSYSLSQCPSGMSGRLYELCAECPRGARCRDGSFTGPVSANNFYNTEVPVRDPETGEITDRALQFCSPDTYNDTLLNDYPDLVQRDYCSGFLGCEPKSACTGENKCATGYEYALPICQAKRNYTALGFLNVTRATVGAGNLCDVTLNPYTFEYEGNDTQCRTNPLTGMVVAKGASCTAGNEELCAKCTVFKDGDDAYFGACECTLPPRCSLCTMGEYYRLNNECVKCPSNIPLLITGLILLAIFMVLLGFYLSREKVNLAFITIVIDYFQVLAIMSSTKVPWPPMLRQIYQFMTVFFINIDITAPECLSPNFDYQTKWWLQMALPIALAVVLVVIYLSYAAVKMVRWGIYESHVYTSHLSALIAVMIISMYYLYLVITKKALEVFDCNPVDPDDGFMYTAFTSLECEGGGLCRCNVPGGPQQNLYPFAILFLCLYTFGYPLYIAFVLRRSALLVREDQYLRAYAVGYMRKTNPNCYDMRKRYSKLYYQFKPRYAPFWILVLLMRKFWIAFAFIIFRGNPSFQLAVVLLVLFTSIVFQVLWRPFLSSGDNAMIMRELDAMAERSIKEPAFAEYREIQKRVQECITLNVEYNRRQKQNKAGIQLFNKAQEERGNNLGMEMAIKEGKVSRSVAAARWFTNLNTLEFILLGCAILICLSGIMFDASARDRRSLVLGQIEAVTYLALLLLIFSLIYIILFFLSEVSPAFMSVIISLCKRRADENAEDEFYDPNINLRENPMFAAPKVEFADNRALQQELDSQMSQLKTAEAQNKRLREDLRRQKQENQMEETARQKTTGLDNVKPATQRKEFTQTKLNQALVGPNRARARGGKKKDAEVADEDEFGEMEEEATPKKDNLLRRVSMAFTGGGGGGNNRRKSFRPQEDV